MISVLGEDQRNTTM